MRASLIGALVLLVSSAASAQTQPDSRWTPWLGCWQLIMEAGAGGNTAAVDELPRVCVTPAQGGAMFTTTVSGRSSVQQTLVADGTNRPVDEAGCRGTQRAEWSANGPRLFARAELTCEGDAGTRRVSGLALLAQDGTWVDIQAVDMNSTDSVRVRQYRRVDADSARLPLPGRSFTVEDVKEAIKKVSPAAVEAAIVETHAAIPLSGKILVDLQRAAVPERVIDLMVAIAYPERFVVERSSRTNVAPASVYDDAFYRRSYGSAYWPYWLGGMYDYYGSPYAYSPFGYEYYGRVIFVDGGGGGGGGGGNAGQRPSGDGRVIDGRGYTQVRSRADAEAPPRNRPTSTSSGGSASLGPPTSTASSSASSSSSGSSGSSSGGYSAGAGSTDTGRTAVPR